MEGAHAYIEKEFFPPILLRVIKTQLKEQVTKRVYVHGQLKAPAQIEAFRARGIETVAISDLVDSALQADPTREFRRTLALSELLEIKTAAKLTR